MGSIKDRNGMDLTEAEDINKKDREGWDHEEGARPDARSPEPEADSEGEEGEEAVA